MDRNGKVLHDLISVIVPVYRVEKYLDKCIASIVSQTYRRLEIILVDDGSPDGCGTICNRWAEEDSRIKVIHKTNGGLSDARNAGLDLATGEFISFVDGDDYIHPNMLRKLWQTIKEYEADLAICGFYHVDETGNQLEIKGIELENGIIDKKDALNGIINNNRRFNCAVWNKLYRNRLFKNLEFSFGKVYEDRMIMPWIVERSSRIAVTTDVLYYYVHTDNSISRSNSIINQLDRVEALYSNLIFFEKYYPDLAQNIALRVINQYIITRNQMEKDSALDKKRLQEAKKMVRYCFSKYGKQIHIMYKLNFVCPTLYNTLIHAKKKLIRR